MAKLTSIYISGIRSYGIAKEDAQVLSFQSPVTLFLGQNGCGKTTIIEAVKYALTGDFPFSGKIGGQTFVTDPTLYKLTHVKGCIKLKFHDIYGNPATISRVLKLECNKSKMKFSTEDASYCYMDRDGIERALSVKLADCKEMITSLVGVSEAVLNNVLFCHQEDSLWPISEDGKVKMKFDQIFESARYDSALDVLARIIKRRTEMLRNLTRELGYLKDTKENAQRKRASLKQKEASLKMLNNESEDSLERLKPLKQKLNEVIGMEESYCQLHKIMSNKESELKGNQNLQASIKDLIQFPFDGSNDELEREMANFQKQFALKQNELDRVEAEISKLKNIVRKVTTQQQEKKVNLAGLQEQINAYKRKLDEREGHVKTLLNKFNCRLSENHSDNLETLKIEMAREHKSLIKKEKELGLQEMQAQKEIDKCQDAHIKVKSNETLKCQERQVALDAKRDTETQLEDLSASDIEFKNFESKILGAQKEIDKVLASFNEESANKTLEKNRKRIRDLRETLEELDQDMKIFLTNSVNEERIDSVLSDRASKEKEIRNLKNKHHKEFKLLFMENIPNKNIRGEVGKNQIKYSQALQKLKNEVSNKEKQASKLNTDLSVKKMELANMKKELYEGSSKIEKLCKNVDFETKRTQVAENNNALQTEKGQLSALKIIFKQFVNEISEKKCCPVCDTDFSNKLQTVEKVAAQMKEKIRSIPDRLKTINIELETGEKLHSSLVELNPIHLKTTELQNNIESRQKQVEQLEEKHAKILEDLQCLKAEVEANQKMYDACVHIISSAALIDQHSGDVAIAESKLIELRAKILTIDSNRSKSETENLIEETKEEISRLNDENDRLSKKSNACQARLHELRTLKSNLGDAQLKLRQAVQGKPQLIEKQKQLEEKLTELEDVIAELENESLCTLSDLEESKHRLAALKKSHGVELNEARTQLQSYESAFKDIQKLNNEIQKIEQNNLPAACEKMKIEITKFQGELERFEEDASKLNVQRDQLKDVLRDQDATDKSLQNTKKLRELKVVEAKLKAEIKTLALDLADKNYNSIAEERIRLLKEISAIESTLCNIEGQVKALNENIKDIARELASYRTDPIKAYQLKFCEIKFEQLVIEDYRRMNEVVSGALCKFHCDQLSSINIRLKEHWQAIYKGNDIDYIQIQSGETDVARMRRQFSYCLIQKKGSMITQMRGKCSAGQKVLACLLVRIVLAEHFSLKCGIFALDEPTTNLDRDNIRSLSSAIAKLISNHRSQANFQFLIITHDEEFLDALREADALEHYYKVQRNALGRSFVVKERI